MNQTILERLNTCAKANDILYFLGDFCIAQKHELRNSDTKFKCKKIFAVPGNHDKDTRNSARNFHGLNDLAEVSLNGQRIVLCHYAMRVWNQSSRGAWHLYGHSTEDCQTSTLQCRWMLEWTLTIFALGILTRSAARWH